MYDLAYVRNDYKEYNECYSIKDSISKMLIYRHFGYRVIAYVVEDIYNQSIRYRVDHMLEVIEEVDDWCGIRIQQSNTDILMAYLDAVDIIIIHRVNGFKIGEFLEKARSMNIPIFFDIDDYCFHENCIEHAQKATGFNANNRVDMIRGYQKTIEYVRGIITSTDYLRREIEKVYEKRVFTYHNFMNSEENRVANEYYLEKQNEKKKGLFEIGYFCGSNGHNKDFEGVAAGIARFMEKNCDTALRIVGAPTIPDCLNRYIDTERLIMKPFMSGCDLLKEIAEVDVNIIPLLENPFSEARSEIKYYSAAMVGTISIASPMMIYKSISKRDSNLILCADKWESEFQKAKDNDIMYSENDRKRVEEVYGFCKQKEIMRLFLDEIYD